MDPEANLKEQAEIARRIIAINDEHDSCGEDDMERLVLEGVNELALRLAELCEAYCNWISRGGAKP